jgi:glycosyltransferase involved in cell wall biosynthesis
MIRVLHILPALNIGGVEIGVKTSLPALRDRFDYRIFSLKGPGSAGVPTLSRMAFLRHILDSSSRPDIVVSSLWPSHPLGWALQAFGIRWLPFFHAANSEGPPRDQILGWAARHSKVHLCDSRATADHYGFTGLDTIVCPFIFKRAHGQPAPREREFGLVVCGRLSPEKRPDLILSFLEQARDQWQDQRALLLLGADDSSFAAFKADAERRGIRASILQNVPSDDVADYFRSAKFYLNLSDYEGFSMTTAEALYNGCVPVVRPVGEIPSYLPPDAGIYVSQPDAEGFAAAIDTCKQLSPDPDRRAAMAAAGIEGLEGYEGYVEAFSRALHHAMKVL